MSGLLQNATLVKANRKGKFSCLVKVRVQDGFHFRHQSSLKPELCRAMSLFPVTMPSGAVLSQPLRTLIRQVLSFSGHAAVYEKNPNGVRSWVGNIWTVTRRHFKFWVSSMLNLDVELKVIVTAWKRLLRLFDLMFRSCRMSQCSPYRDPLYSKKIICDVSFVLFLFLEHIQTSIWIYLKKVGGKLGLLASPYSLSANGAVLAKIMFSVLHMLDLIPALVS